MIRSVLPVQTPSFARFLSVRAGYGATFDRGGGRIYFLSTASGLPGLWGLRLDRPGAWPEPLAVGAERVQYAFAGPRPGRVLFGVDRGGDERTQLQLLDRPGDRPRPLTAAPEAIHHFGDWHQDGRVICFASNTRDPRFFELELLDVESGERRLVFQADANQRAVGFEPGGRRILVQRIHTPFAHELLLVDPNDGTARSLTAAEREGRYISTRWAPDGRRIYCASDRGGDFLELVALDLVSGGLERLSSADGDVEDLALAPDGRTVVYALNRDGYVEARLLDLVSRTERALPLGERRLCYDAGRWSPTFAWSPDGARIALSLTDATTAPDVWLVEADGSARCRITWSWDAELPTETLVEPELVRYPSFDRRQIPAFVYRPPAAPRDGTAPALFYVHGGPESQFQPSFNPVVQYFTARGFMVVAPNVRGSTGYGKAYSHLDDLERRPDAVRDLAAGAEWLAASGQAHPRRIAVMGGSYGGYMVLAALTDRPDLWAAGVDIVGIANFVTFLERTGPWRRRQREAEYGSLERDRALLERLSPLQRADRIVAPLLVIHGANDPRVPVSEAEQIVATLRSRGRPVEYLRYEDEGHGLVRLPNRLDAYPKIADFLERHLAV
jgi:dipeptidyl aminopeptidase/acylaminoacyl peptidase